MGRRHHFSIQLRNAMSFAAPSAGPELDRFIQAIDPQVYLSQMEVVVHNRCWLAGCLFRQGQYDDAVSMLMSAEAVQTQIMLAQVSILSGSTKGGEA